MPDGGSTVPTGPAGDAVAELLAPACDVPDVPEHPVTARHSDADAARALSAVGGCAAVRADGHDVEALNAAWSELSAEDWGKGMRVLLARTVRGRGLPHGSDELTDDEGPLDRQAADVLISGIRREL